MIWKCPVCRDTWRERRGFCPRCGQILYPVQDNQDEIKPLRTREELLNEQRYGKKKPSPGRK